MIFVGDPSMFIMMVIALRGNYNELCQGPFRKHKNGYYYCSTEDF